MPNRLRVGRYGRFGGRFTTEALWSPLQRLGEAFDEALRDEGFVQAFESFLDDRLGRPTPVSSLRRLSETYGGGELYLKRDDLCQGGSFCASLAAGQALLAARMGFERVIGETATGDFGVALGSAAAGLGLSCRIFMGREDYDAEPINVARMQRLGVDVRVVDASSRGRRAAIAEAMRYWSAHVDEALYCASSAAMADPYPRMSSYFLSVIGAESAVQMRRIGRTPDYVVAPVGSGGFAAGLFGDFAGMQDVQLVGVQADADGSRPRSAASLQYGAPGVFQGTFSYLLQDADGQIDAPNSLAAGLDTPVVGPQHARWAEEGRVLYAAIDDDEAVSALCEVAAVEGIVVSLEAAHAVGYALKLLPTLRPDQAVLVGVSGEGTRDLARLTALEDEEESA